MVFRKSRRKIELQEDVIIDNVKIDFVTQTKFLGVILDQHLTFESHVQYTKGKIARGIGILYKAKKYLKESSMKTLYSVSPIYRGRLYRGIGYIAVACWTPFFAHWFR